MESLRKFAINNELDLAVDQYGLCFDYDNFIEFMLIKKHEFYGENKQMYVYKDRYDIERVTMFGVINIMDKIPIYYRGIFENGIKEYMKIYHGYHRIEDDNYYIYEILDDKHELLKDFKCYYYCKSGLQCKLSARMTDGIKCNKLDLTNICVGVHYYVDTFVGKVDEDRCFISTKYFIERDVDLEKCLKMDMHYPELIQEIEPNLDDIISMGMTVIHLRYIQIRRDDIKAITEEKKKIKYQQ